MAENVDGAKLPHLQKHRRRLGWQPPEAVATVVTAPGIDAPNAVPSGPELPETPEVQFKKKTFDAS